MKNTVDWRKSNPTYKPETVKEMKVNGKSCAVIDDGRIADAARDFGHRPVKVTR